MGRVSVPPNMVTISSDAAAKRLVTRFRALAPLLTSFGLVGGIAFLVDFGVYNIVRATVLADSPIWSKVVSVAVATVVAWIGNRYLTFRATRGRTVFREALLFAAMNVVGLLIAAACLYVSHYLLGFTSQLADNIAGNGIGLVLGTAFRFVAYRYIVFRSTPSTADDAFPRPRGVAPVSHDAARALTPERA